LAAARRPGFFLEIHVGERLRLFPRSTKAAGSGV
jgi:hypothetical protein